MIFSLAFPDIFFSVFNSVMNFYNCVELKSAGLKCLAGVCFLIADGCYMDMALITDWRINCNHINVQSNVQLIRRLFV